MKIGFDEFVPGESKVQFAGIYWGEEERAKINEVLDRGWFGPGPMCHELEKRLAEYHGLKKASLTNSGSSANLLALAALKELHGLQEGDEIIVPAVSFPTTVNPIIQLGFTPVFVDIELGTYNIDIVEARWATAENTVAIMPAHALGIPWDVDTFLKWQEDDQEPLLIFEDCCDAMGSQHYSRTVGTFGDIATLSFYASHNMTCAGEGGAVLSNSKDLMRIVRSLRDWGKMCSCEPCPITVDPTKSCVLGYQETIDGLEGMDRRYSYGRLGYNMQMTELQAAFGLAQMNRLGEFAFIRKRNFYALQYFFEDYQDWFILPRFYKGSDPVPFCYPLTVRDEAPFTRLEIVRYLEDRKIETRQLFGGNLVRQPAYKSARHRIGSSLENSDKIMRDAFFVGVWPGIDMPRLDFMLQTFEDFLSAF